MKYDVHLYPVVRVKVCGVEAENQEQAIEKAENLIGDDLHPMFDHCLADNVCDVEFAEEIAYYLVDEEGDEEYDRTCWYQWRDGKLQNMDEHVVTDEERSTGRKEE